MPQPDLSHQGRQPLSVLRGVGPAVGKKLAEKGILTLQDLWLQLPIGFEDRTQICRLDDLQLGQSAQVEVRVMAVERGFRFRPMLKVTVEDDSLRQLSLPRFGRQVEIKIGRSGCAGVAFLRHGRPGNGQCGADQSACK